MILHTAQLCDYLRHSSALGVQRDDHIQLVNAGEAHQRIHLGQAFAFQQQMIRAVAVDHGDTRKQSGKLLTAGIVLLNQLDGDPVPVQHGCQIEADPSTAAEHDPTDPACDNAKAAQQCRQILGGSRYKDTVSFPQDEVSFWRDGRPVSQNGAYQHPAICDAVHVAQRNIAQLAGSINPQFHDLRAALGKGVPLQKAGILQQMGDFLCRLVLRIDGHGQAKYILHGIDLLGVFRIPDSGNGVQLRIQAVRRGTAQQIDGIRVRCRDQQFRVLYPSLPEDAHGRAVSGDCHHIILFQ